MAWTKYMSTDASAPVLSGTVNSLVAVFDAILVNGYGSQPAAGWTKPYTGTNKAAFRNGSGATSRKYIRVLDDGALATSGAREATLTGYDTMSDVDTGTASFGPVYARKSATADATARVWIAFADDRTLIFFSRAVDTTYTTNWNAIYAGEIISYKANDTQAFFLSARYTSNVATPSAETLAATLYTSSGAFSTSNNQGYMAGSGAGVAGGVMTVRYPLPGEIVAGSTGVAGVLAYPSTVDGGVQLGEVQVVEGTNTAAVLRGYLRGVVLSLHPVGSIGDGATLTGTGDLASRSFFFFSPYVSRVAASSLGSIGVETTTPATTP